MTKRRWRMIIKFHNRELPLWMYYVAAIAGIVDGVLELFLLPFDRFPNFGQVWRGYMLRSIRRYCPESFDGGDVQAATAGGGSGCTDEPQPEIKSAGSY